MLRTLLACLLSLCIYTGTAHAVTFVDVDFNTCTTMVNCGFVNVAAANNMLPSTELVFEGAKSLRLEWLNGTVQPFADLVVTLGDHLFYRGYMREAPGFQLPANFHSKMIRMTGVNSNPHLWLYRSGCGYRFDMEAPFIGPFFPGTQQMDNLVICSNRQMSTTKWDLVEIEWKLNTPGSANGELRLWVDGTLVIQHLNGQYRGPTPTSTCGNNAGVYPCKSTMTLGNLRTYIQGGSGKRYYDRMALGNTRIFGVGTPPPPDTTPPPTPVLTATPHATLATVNLSWTTVVDGGSGLGSHTIRWCAGGSCTPSATLTTVNATTFTFQHTSLANATTYGYCVIAADNASNASPCSTPTKYATTESPPPPPDPPTIIGLTGTPTSLTVTHGPVTATTIRIQLGDNAGNFEQNPIYPIASFPGGVLSIDIPAGTQFTCAYPRDATGVENNVSGAYRCIGAIAGVPPVDETPVVFGTPFPAQIRPAGTTSALYGVPIDKVAACKSDSVDRAYVDMDTGTTAVQMDVANLTASATIGSLTNGSTNTRYIRCAFQNTFDDIYPNLTSAVATIAVDTSTADTTPPGTVVNVVATPELGTSNMNVVWDAASGGDVAFYRLYLSTGACSVYQLTGQPITITSYLLTLLPNTAYCFKVEAVDTSGNPSVELSLATTATTSFVSDLEPPSIPVNFRLPSPPLTHSVVFSWDHGTDNLGSVFSEVELCQGAGCVNFAPFGTRTLSNSVEFGLSPGTAYRARMIHYDGAGNPSGGIENPMYSDILSFTTASVGLSTPRAIVPFGTGRPATIPPQVTNRPPRP